MEEVAPESYADSPFIEEIAKVVPPKTFMIPSMRTYDRTSDPQNHVAFNKLKMLAASIPNEFRQVCKCKGFGTTLTGPALQWITQKPDETLIVFLARFNKEKVSIPRLEEDKIYKVGGPCNRKHNDKTNRRSQLSMGNNYRSGPYTRPGQSEVNLAQEQQGKAKVHPPISEHNFCVDIAGLIQQLDNMGPVVRWPRKSDNPNPRKYHTKWCEFHIDIGHTMEDCFTLKKEVVYLLKAGYLKDLIKARGRNEDLSKVNPEQKQCRSAISLLHLHSMK
ncbi:uncharacterized protein LOC141601247 [Silene latifolia]|uniref:uncharacterized protein LOC141601247 n=1 Tax=Silene latifolia TaxID=37657 RepID=UPI003D76FE1E